MTTRTATLKGGGTIRYVEVDDPPAGGMKKTFFTPDKKQVVQFFHDAAAARDVNRLARLEAVVGRYNPTLDPTTGEYFRKLFCWPTGIVVAPTVGVVCPAYPQTYFFEAGPFSGKEKKGKWFSSPKLRGYLPASELGDWIKYFQICLKIARAIRRLHAAGLAHSDLSCNNVLIDPARGDAVVIDIDSLVVPGVFPPDVLGTPGYIAPEVLRTLHLPLNDRNRSHPCAATDQHALAVLIYEYLLYRHPLRGPKIHSATSAEEDEMLAMGEKALFVEHPAETSNRPTGLTAAYTDFGPHLADLFKRAFVDGLHAPNRRPAAVEWERGLMRSWDLLHPCAGARCPHKWFVVAGPGSRCPFCGTKPGRVPVLKLRRQVKPGQWMPDGELVVHGSVGVFPWHAFDNAQTGERAERKRLGYFGVQAGQWLLVNEHLDSLTTESGNRVPAGQAVALIEGKPFQFSTGPHGRLAEVAYY